MLRRRAEPRATVAVSLDGVPVRAAAGDSVAALLLLAGAAPYRLSTVGGVARAPFCMIGNCFDCLVEIDGVPNRQGCLVPVAEGMAIRRQQGKPEVTT
jgi:D-hydroxyproline dehydrogenase subunit gamma